MAFDPNSRILEFIKAYLIGLTNDPNLIASDLDPYVSFIKQGANHADKNHGTGIIVFKYQNVEIKKTISDFKYQQGYAISIKPGNENLVADDVTKNFIDFSQLPANVEVLKVIPDPSRNDGTTIKVFYKGTKIKEQQLGGFSSYKAKALKVLNALQVKDFKEQEVQQVFLAKQDLKDLVINAIKVNSYGQTPIKKVFKALITKVEYKQDTKVLSLTIRFNEQQKVLSFKF